METGTQEIGCGYHESGINFRGGIDMSGSTRKTGLTVLVATLFIVGVALSVALPYGVGTMVFLFMLAFCGAVYAVGVACFGLLRELMGRSVSFGYLPGEAYMTGKKSRKQVCRGR